jgi:putative tricarboxylic transport membrane protein
VGEDSQSAYPILFPLILVFCLIGSYCLTNSVIEVLSMVTFGLIGYLLRKFDYEAAPLVLAMVLGPRLETSLRRSLLGEQGDLTIFITRPISAGLLIVAISLIVIPLIPKIRKKLLAVPKEE